MGPALRKRCVHVGPPKQNTHVVWKEHRTIAKSIAFNNSKRQYHHGYSKKQSVEAWWKSSRSRRPHVYFLLLHE
jgi:ribulose kinase